MIWYILAGVVLIGALWFGLRYVNTSPKMKDEDDPEHTPVNELYGTDRDRK